MELDPGRQRGCLRRASAGVETAAGGEELLPQEVLYGSEVQGQIVTADHEDHAMSQEPPPGPCLRALLLGPRA